LGLIAVSMIHSKDKTMHYLYDFGWMASLTKKYLY
jgi:hypothetical protein